jgi:Fur family transcriptional regulator, stress-responsive regulator
MSDAGLVRRAGAGGGPARYETRAGDHHHHTVCRGCGAVGDVDCAVGHAPCLRPTAEGGFTIDRAEVTFWGRCARCQAATAGPATRPARAG